MIKVNEEIMPTYYKAKLAADETLTVLGEEKGFQYIILRPGQLIDDKETGKVVMGQTPARGSVTRGDVAEVSRCNFQSHKYMVYLRNPPTSHDGHLLEMSSQD
jgi:hypothetical protein